MSRPTVTIIGADGAASQNTHPLPNVFKAPIRADIVQAVHTGMAKNKRQPYAVPESSTFKATYYKTVSSFHIRPQVSENWASRPLCHT